MGRQASGRTTAGLKASENVAEPRPVTPVTQMGTVVVSPRVTSKDFDCSGETHIHDGARGNWLQDPDRAAEGLGGHGVTLRVGYVFDQRRHRIGLV